MKVIAKLIGGLVFALIVYILFWPVPISPVAWSAPPARAYDGEFAANRDLENFTAIAIDGLRGPEAMVASSDGELFATSHQGWVIRWRENTQPKRWVKLPGRPLGIAFDADGNLWAASANVGLVKVTPAGDITIDLTSVDGQRLGYADDLDIAANGKIYFSDASTKYFANDWGGTLEASLLEIVEHSGSGRIIEFDPSTQQANVIMDNLVFANGVALDPQEQFVLVVETGKYRVWKYWIAGSRAGERSVIIDNLPGFPDNIHVGKQGRFWVGLTGPRATILDQWSTKPFLRKIIFRLPEALRPQLEPYGMVFAINGEGEVLANKQSPSGKVYATTGVAETDNYLYITSLTAPFIARIDKSE